MLAQNKSIIGIFFLSMAGFFLVISTLMSPPAMAFEIQVLDAPEGTPYPLLCDNVEGSPRALYYNIGGQSSFCITVIGSDSTLFPE